MKTRTPLDILQSIGDLTSALALSKAYDLAGNTCCAACGMPASRHFPLEIEIEAPLYDPTVSHTDAFLACEQCAPKELPAWTEGPLVAGDAKYRWLEPVPTTNALGVIRLVKIARGE